MLVRIRGSTNFATEQDCTPLMEACAAGSVRSVKCLVELGADINAYSITQNTPLIYAAAAGQEKVLREESIYSTEKLVPCSGGAYAC